MELRHFDAADRAATQHPACRAKECSLETIHVGALLLDVCGVLYDSSLWHRWLFQLLSRLGAHTDYTAFFRRWRRQYLEQVCCGQRGYWEALRDFLAEAGFSRGQIDEIEAAGHARFRQFEEGIRPLHGVPTTLSRLKQRGLQLNVLAYAPWSEHTLRLKLQQLRLAEHFATVLSCYQLPDASPQERFRKALAAMHLPASEVAYVGHDTYLLAQARGAGLRTLAVNYDSDARADLYLDQFDQLLQVVYPRTIHALAG